MNANIEQIIQRLTSSIESLEDDYKHAYELLEDINRSGLTDANKDKIQKLFDLPF